MSRQLPAPIICLATHSSPGGAQEVLFCLAEGFSSRGETARLVALYPHDARAVSERSKWTYIVAKKPASIWQWVALLIKLIKFFRQVRPRAILSALPAANALAPIGASLARTRSGVILSHHSPADTAGLLKKAVDCFVGLLSSTRHIVCVSNTVLTAQGWRPKRYRAKRSIIFNALPPKIEALINDLLSERRESSMPQRRVVAIGRLAKEKNLSLVVRAAVYLPDVEIMFVGAGPEGDELARQARELGVASRIKFLGLKPREDALSILSIAGIFVQPSSFEGHSLALIEAAKLRLPLLVSEVPGQIEGVTSVTGQRCGITVDTNDERLFANTILRLLDDAAYYREWSDRSGLLASEATYDRMMSAYEGLVRATELPPAAASR